MALQLEREFNHYLANQDEMVRRYNGKVVVIKGTEVLGAYDTEIAAITNTVKEHELGTFLIQRVSPGDKDYTVHIYSGHRAPLVGDAGLEPATSCV